MGLATTTGADWMDYVGKFLFWRVCDGIVVDHTVVPQYQTQHFSGTLNMFVNSSREISVHAIQLSYLWS